MKRSLADTVALQLEEQLPQLASSLRKLPSERELSDVFGVSRPIIREAIRSLLQRGLIEVRPGLGTFAVADIARPATVAFEHSLRVQRLNFASLLEARLLLEPQFAELAALRRSEADLGALSGSFDRMRASVDDIPRFDEADHDFHLALAAAAGNRLFPVWIELIINLLSETHHGVVALGKVSAAILVSHEAILHAVRKQDGAAARAAMTQHLRSFSDHTRMAIELGMLPNEDTDAFEALFQQRLAD